MSKISEMETKNDELINTALHNPFVATAWSDLDYDMEGIRWSVVFRRLDKNNYRACVIGAEGTGKSTFLKTLKRQLEFRQENVLLIEPYLDDRGRICWHWRQICQALYFKGIVLWDSADRAPWLVWQTFKLLRSRRLIVSSHKYAILPCVWRCYTNPLLVCRLLCRFVDAKNARGWLPTVTMLLQIHQGNVRKVWGGLYDIWRSS